MRRTMPPVTGPRELSRAGQSQSQAGLFAVGSRSMNYSSFGSLIERRANVGQGFGRLVFFSGSNQLQVVFFESVQPRLGAAIALLLARAAAHSAFRGFGIGHT